MKKIFLASFLISQLFAQEVVEENDFAPIGESSTMSEETAAAPRETQWQNWVFAASALVTFTVGVVIISLNKGTTN